MSTKIYSGHKFNGTLKELFDVLCIIRDTYRKNAHSIYQELMTKDHGDKVCTFTEPIFKDLKDKPYNTFTIRDWTKFFEGHIYLGHNTHLNTEASIVIFVDNKNDLYLIAFLDNEDSYNLSKYSDKFQYYGYWNNTDKDERCTEEEWATREAKWDELMPGCKPTKDYGFIFNIIEEADVYILVFNTL